MLADAEDQIAFGESLLRRREAEDSAPVAAAASTAADRVSPDLVSPTPVASTPVAPTPQEAPQEAPREAPREADDLLAYEDYLDGDALDRRLSSDV